MYALMLAALLCCSNNSSLTEEIEKDIMQDGQNVTCVAFVGDKGGGASYIKYYFDGYTFYCVDICYYKDKTKSLRIGQYLTNQNFSKFASGKESTAYTLMYGVPLISVESHFTDNGLTGKIYLFQRFCAKKNDVFHGFTRDERDKKKIRRGKQVIPIKETIYNDKKVLVGKRWRDATEEEKKEAQKEYDEVLKDLARIIKHKAVK